MVSPALAPLEVNTLLDLAALARRLRYIWSTFSSKIYFVFRCFK